MDWKLRSWLEGDAPDIARFANNPKIAANLRDIFPSPYTLKDAEEYTASCLNADESAGFQRIIEAGGRAAGNVSISCGGDVYRKSAELGYWLAEPFWGNGIMTEAVRQVCKQAFERYDIVRIYAEPFAWNHASRRVLEKAGFTLEAVLKNSVFKDGKLGDSCIYAMLK